MSKVKTPNLNLVLPLRAKFKNTGLCNEQSLKKRTSMDHLYYQLRHFLARMKVLFAATEEG
jgi:hypothetical protein